MQVVINWYARYLWGRVDWQSDDESSLFDRYKTGTTSKNQVKTCYKNLSSYFFGNHYIGSGSMENYKCVKIFSNWFKVTSQNALIHNNVNKNFASSYVYMVAIINAYFGWNSKRIKNLSLKKNQQKSTKITKKLKKYNSCYA